MIKGYLGLRIQNKTGGCSATCLSKTDLCMTLVGFEPTTLRLKGGCSATELQGRLRTFYPFRMKIQPATSAGGACQGWL